eukprot:12883083-Prorocentrum_lima.AAC.1
MLEICLARESSASHTPAVQALAESSDKSLIQTCLSHNVVSLLLLFCSTWARSISGSPSENVLGIKNKLLGIRENNLRNSVCET